MTSTSIQTALHDEYVRKLDSVLEEDSALFLRYRATGVPNPGTMSSRS